jgi:hypothetical protein
LLAQAGSTLLSRSDFIQNWKTSKEFTIAVAPDAREVLQLQGESGRDELRDFADPHRQFQPLPLRAGYRSQDSAAGRAQGMEQGAFDYCIDTLGTITEEQLKQYPVDWYQRPAASGSQILLGMYAHTAHHRAKAEVCMRANNIKPPDYRP